MESINQFRIIDFKVDAASNKVRYEYGSLHIASMNTVLNVLYKTIECIFEHLDLGFGEKKIRISECLETGLF